MTVKRNGDRVILKDGKVSCSCCEAGQCCMYPAQALFDGLYSYQDLPDTLIQPVAGGGNIVFTRLNPPQISEGGLGIKLSYYHGIDSFDQIVGVGLRLTPDPQQIFQWEGSEVPNEAADFGECLLSIQTFQPDPLVWDSLQDQFADTYTVTYLDDSAQVTRESICVWAGTTQSEGITVLWRLEYSSINDPEAPAYLKWVVSIQGLTTIAGIKLPYQNTPVGTYGSEITVS